MVAMATGIVRKNYTCQTNIIWILGYHSMMLWKGYQNFFHKIWKPYLKWYISILGMEYLKSIRWDR